MKVCPKCKEQKDFSEFGKDKKTKTGLSCWCKLCMRKKNENHKKNNPDYYKNYAEKYREKNREDIREKSNKRFLSDKDRYLQKSRESYHKHKEEIALRRKEKRSTPEARKKERERQNEWRKGNGELYRSYVRKWQVTNRQKINAHAKVHRAVVNGLLRRKENCEMCALKCKTEGHHEDYSKPLDVIWLCRKCHASKIEKVGVL